MVHPPLYQQQTFNLFCANLKKGLNISGGPEPPIPVATPLSLPFLLNPLALGTHPSYGVIRTQLIVWPHLSMYGSH